jgi:hypothetical protein
LWTWRWTSEGCIFYLFTSNIFNDAFSVTYYTAPKKGR